jgi:small subunit ribosomal protein S3
LGQKVHPRGLRLGINETWDSRWYAEKDYIENLHEDFAIRDIVRTWNYKGDRKEPTGKALKRAHRENLRFSSISKVEIERKAKNVTVYINTSKPGIVIGKNGETIESLSKHLRAKTGKNVDIKIRPIEQPDLDAWLVGESLAMMIERRFAVRRAIKQTVEKVMRAGAEGVKISCSGRLGGSEIARKEWTRRGRVPLHTLNSHIDYALTEAFTTYGKIGIKIWIFKGEKTPKQFKQELLQQASE